MNRVAGVDADRPPTVPRITLHRWLRIESRRRARDSLVRALVYLEPVSSSEFSTSRMVTDKKDRPLLLVASRHGSSLIVRAFRSYRAGHEAVLFASIEGSQATIRDIGCFTESGLSHGVGTALLRLAEEIFRREGATRIMGHLSPADFDHRGRQVHFYLKNGYEVCLDGLEGTVRKWLNEAEPPSP
jgi:GNAT superfamily N-acetyltransferase